MIKQASNIKYLVSAILLPFLFFSCNPARKLKDGEHLLYKNHVINKDTKVDNGDIESYIRQKPNKKILLVARFHLWLYNLADEDRVKRKRILHDQKREKKNNRRIGRGKKPKSSDRQLMGEWLLNIGEPPVIYDSSLTKRSSQQISSFLHKKGYFINSVKDSVRFKDPVKWKGITFLRRRKAHAYYTIKAAAPYTINNIEYKIKDEQLSYYVLADTSASLIERGNIYDEDVLQDERERITGELNNNGYFDFTRDYIHYDVDTTIGNKKVNITLIVKNFAKKYSETSDSIVETPHIRYYVNTVYVESDFVSKQFNSVQKDTFRVNDNVFIQTGKRKYKTRVLTDAIFIRKGELYQQKNVESTYKRLSELKAFKTINIRFEHSGKGDYLDCYIQLTPIYKQSLTIETEATNTSGNAGIASSIVYQNRNLKRGAEILEVRIKGGLEIQQVFGTNNSANARQFYTLELGPELNLTVPRFLLPVYVKPSRRANPKTTFTSSLIYQRRPQYTRYITNISYGYNWKETTKKRHIINPIVINFVKVQLSPDFSAYLNDNINDLYTLNSFSNHLATSTVYTFMYNDGFAKKMVNFPFFKVSGESSGNILRGIYNSVNHFSPGTFPMDEQGRYKFMDVVYSQYLRIDGDFRYYFNSNEINKVVLRFAAGVGVPLKNFNALPFERSFFSGGSNGIRAWQSRTLGPGSYADDGVIAFDQFGDGQIEANVEYRFKMIKMLNGALFVDAGNVWMRNRNPSKPGAEFEWNRFYKEIALGSGAGIRSDFSFFVLRLDVGLKLYDPQFAESKRWVIRNITNVTWKNDYKATHNNHKYSFFVFNIGINYPF